MQINFPENAKKHSRLKRRLFYISFGLIAFMGVFALSSYKNGMSIDFYTYSILAVAIIGFAIFMLLQRMKVVNSILFIENKFEISFASNLQNKIVNKEDVEGLYKLSGKYFGIVLIDGTIINTTWKDEIQNAVIDAGFVLKVAE